MEGGDGERIGPAVDGELERSTGGAQKAQSAGREEGKHEVEQSARVGGVSGWWGVK